MEVKARSFCRNCVATCAIELTIEDNAVKQVAASPKDDRSRRYFCVKGRMSAEFGSSDDRLTSCLRRTPGGFETVDAQIAMDEIAAKLNALIAEHGPRSVALYYGTGAYYHTLGSPMSKLWLDAIGSPNFFTTVTIDQGAKWVTWRRMGYFASGKYNMNEADVALMVGTNPVVSHLGYPYSPFRSANPGAALREAKARGLKILAVDPRSSETTRFADIHLRIVPGEDPALFAGLINIVLQNGWEDREFCDRHVTNLEALREAVRPFTAEYAASRAGVTASELYEVARIFSHAERPLAGSGTGPSMCAHSNLAEHLIETFNAICGGYRRAGDRVQNPGVLFPRDFAEMALPPNRTWETGVKCRSEDVGKLYGEFPTALLPKEIMKPGKDKIRALIVFGGNPALAIVDPEQTVAALKDLDLLVTLDPRMTPTAELSHYVMAPTTQYERHDLSMMAEGGDYLPVAAYAKPVLQRPPGVIDEWEFFWGLAARMKLQIGFKSVPVMTSPDDVRGAPSLSLSMENKPEPEGLIKWLCSQGGVAFERLEAATTGFVSDAAPTFVQPTPDGHRDRLDLAPTDVIDEIRTVYNEVVNSEFRYRLTVRRLLETMNSAFRENEVTKRRYPSNFAFMNSEDMTRENLQNGVPIRIVSEHGEIFGIAKNDPGLRPGVISMSHGWGRPTGMDDDGATAGGHTGSLVSLDHHVEDIIFMPRQTAIPVNVFRDA